MTALEALALPSFDPQQAATLRAEVEQMAGPTCRPCSRRCPRAR
jgi:hypothetical protein